MPSASEHPEGYVADDNERAEEARPGTRWTATARHPPAAAFTFTSGAARPRSSSSATRTLSYSASSRVTRVAARHVASARANSSNSLQRALSPRAPTLALVDLSVWAAARSDLQSPEAHARRTMGYTDPRKLSAYVKAPDCPEAQRTLRQIAKARVLGLGFGMGHKKLRDYAKAQIGLELPEELARKVVTEFRAANPGITALWRRFDTLLRQHVSKKDRALFQVELPSWRALEYFDFNESSGGITARDERGGMMKHWHGGILTENLVQATARDVLVENILRIEAAGYSVVLHVHDEVIVEVDADVPEDAIYRCMAVTPAWAEGLPVDSSVASAERYFKD